MNASDLLSQMRRTVEQIAAFNEIAKALTSTLEVGEVLRLVMQKVSELLRPANWSLILFDDKTGELYFEIAVGEGAEKLKGLRIKPGEGIAGMVFNTGEPWRVDDVSAEPQFASRFDRVSTFETRSVLAVPLKVRGRSLGVIELVSGRTAPPFSDEDVQAVAGVADFAAIAIDNARNFQRVQELTLIDEHTGLYNARHLRATLELEVQRASRFEHPLALLFLDLDHFKRVNDTHGHLVGSALLREVGELLNAQIRQVDSAYRYGGDEFAVVLLETDAVGALNVAERIRDSFRKKRFLAARQLNLVVTASIGLAVYPKDGEGASELLKAADTAMYRAKASGRDAVMAA